MICIADILKITRMALLLFYTEVTGTLLKISVKFLNKFFSTLKETKMTVRGYANILLDDSSIYSMRHAYAYGLYQGLSEFDLIKEIKRNNNFSVTS